MSKRVIAINSSKRKKNTYNMLVQLKQQMSEKDIVVDIINLFDYNIQPCIGCQHCLKEDGCVIKDDAEELMKKMTEYDGIILSTPVYLNNVSGKLKVFVDRTCSWFHRPELVGKPILFVSTTAGSGLKNTLKYLENLSIQWGAFPTDKIGRNIRGLKNKIEEHEYKKFLKYMQMNKENFKPTTNQIITFQVQRVMAQKLLPKDKEYWTKKGWMDKIYFYDCNISFINKIIAKRFYNMMYKKIEYVGED